MSLGWSLFVIALVVANIVGCAWLLAANRSAPVRGTKPGEPMEHEYDGIRELNNPLPAWWSWLFIATLVFGVVYLAAYPGLGGFGGWLGWSSTGQYDAQIAEADAQYGPILDAYYAQPIEALTGDSRAVEMGGRLFANHCAACHGSDARGGQGFPNLTDADWLYGGEPETIVTTITNGRIGNMPGMGPVLGDEGVRDMAQYVLGLSGREHDSAMAARAEPKFKQICTACHGQDAKGMQAVGAPNLTDDIWLHRGRLDDIEYQIANGRINQMPAHGSLLSQEKIHLLAVYVKSLSAGP